MIELLGLYFLIGLSLLIASALVYFLFFKYEVVQAIVGSCLFCGILTGIGFLVHTFIGVIL